MTILQLHPVKTGGRALNSHLKDHYYCGHKQLKEVVKNVGGFNEFINYHSIVVTRNPYSRLRSLHRFYSVYHEMHIKRKYSMSFYRFVHEFRDTLTKICPLQSRYIVYNDVVVVDFIAKFEDYGRELTYHLIDFGYNRPIPMKRLRPWKPFYNKGLQDIVYEMYEEDFIRLGYDYKI